MEQEWIGEIKQIGFQVMAKCNKFSADLMLSGSVFNRVVMATERARVTAFILNNVHMQLCILHYITTAACNPSGQPFHSLSLNNLTEECQ